MSVDPEPSTSAKRLPTLVSLCQKVVSNNADNIYGLGEGEGPTMAYELIKPILTACSAENLDRIEQASPWLQAETQDIWQEKALAKWPKIAEEYRLGYRQHPSSWRDEYISLEGESSRRLEQLINKMRGSRQEADAKKKENEIKMLPYRVRERPAKRFKWGGQPAKTLFQKAKAEAGRIQKTVYNSKTPPLARQYRPQMNIASSSTSSLLSTSPTSSGSTNSGSTSRVTVRTVTVQRPSFTYLTTVTPYAVQPSSFPSSSSTNIRKPVNSSSASANAGAILPTESPDSQSKSEEVTSSTLLPPAPEIAPRPVAKKKPTNSLFMPKSRAYSQLSASR